LHPEQEETRSVKISMELSGVEKSGTVAPVPFDPAWDEAFLRVESYLRAHHVESRVLLNQIATEIIREARQLLQQNPNEEPVVAAMHATHTRMGSWFARVGHVGDWSDERVRARGRLSLVLGESPVLEQNCFLSTAEVPANVTAALANGVLLPNPELHLSNMPPAPLEFGFNDPADPSISQKSTWGTVREAAGWLVLVGLYGAAWAASH
jgi:hypothetical protein